MGNEGHLFPYYKESRIDAKVSVEALNRPRGLNTAVLPTTVKSSNLCSLIGLERFFVRKYKRSHLSLKRARSDNSGHGVSDLGRVLA